MPCDMSDKMNKLKFVRVAKLSIPLKGLAWTALTIEGSALGDGMARLGQSNDEIEPELLLEDRRYRPRPRCYLYKIKQQKKTMKTLEAKVAFLCAG